jgi:hypothetical protein
MDDFIRPDHRGFSSPTDRTVWAWIAGAAIVAIVLTFLATAGSEHPKVAGDTDTVGQGQRVVPPITQPTPLKPSDIEQPPL